MQFNWPFLDTLTIPTGAGPTDDRIVINGTDGTIEIYEGSTLIISIDPTTGLTVGPFGTNNIFVRLDTLGTTQAGIILDEDRWNLPAEVVAYQDLTTAVPTLMLNSPTEESSFPAGDQATIYLQGEELDSSTKAQVNVTSDNNGGLAVGQIKTEFAIEQKRIGVGIMYQQVLTANSSGYTADSVTDFAISNARMVAGHTYAFHLHTLTNLSAATGDWKLYVRRNGTNLANGLIGYVQNVAATSENRMVDGTVYYTATADGGTDDFEVYADEIGGTTTLTFLADATDEARTFTMTDEGVLI